MSLVLAISVLVPFGCDYVYAAEQTAAAAEPASEPAIEPSQEPAGEIEEPDFGLEEPVNRPTVITGVPASINKRYNQTVSFKVTVTPATGKRSVKLQRYNSSTGKWNTIKTYTTKSADAATVTVKIDKKYRKKTTSFWRVYVPAKGDAESAISDQFTLTTRNLKTQKLSAKAAVIYRIDEDGKGTLIYTKNSDTKRAQASTTKLMTAVLFLENGDLGGITKISKHAASTPWSGHFVKGDTYNNRDLMFAMLMPSANDAAVALAETIGGTESNFVKMMNAKAKTMGLRKTQFKNPHGLDARGHYTTATELAKLTAYAYTTQPLISEIWNTKVKMIRSIKKGRKWKLWTTNAIFGYDKNFKGGKTGTEDNARCCFTGIYVYKGKTYVTTVLGSSYGFSRWADTKKLHSYIKKYAAGKY